MCQVMFYTSEAGSGTAVDDKTWGESLVAGKGTTYDLVVVWMLLVFIVSSCEETSWCSVCSVAGVRPTSVHCWLPDSDVERKVTSMANDSSVEISVRSA
jgi:hypothetical protein